MSVLPPPGAQDLMGPQPTLLADDADVRAALDAGTPAAEVVRADPTARAAWATLAEQALDRDAVESYAYARTGYHRSLDALRRAGWRGAGPVPWSHEPNRGYLRCVAALLRAAAAIDEHDEVERLRALLADGDPRAVAELGLT